MKQQIDRIRLIIAVALVIVAGVFAVWLAPTSADATLLELATPAAPDVSPPECDPYPVVCNPYPGPYPAPPQPGAAFMPFVAEESYP